VVCGLGLAVGEFGYDSFVTVLCVPESRMAFMVGRVFGTCRHGWVVEGSQLPCTMAAESSV
jgi:hypothetical protein